MLAIIFPLIGAAVALGVVLLLSLFAGKKRPAFIAGLRPAVCAYLVQLVILAIIRPAIPVSAATFSALFLVFVGPTIEESFRLGFMRPLRVGDWLYWGSGFAIFEAVLKFNDFLVIIFARHAAPLVLLATPLVPFFLHVFLSVTALALLSRGWSRTRVALITLLLHGAHNASVLFDAQFEQHTIAEILTRVVIFGGLILGIVKLAER